MMAAPCPVIASLSWLPSPVPCCPGSQDLTWQLPISSYLALESRIDPRGVKMRRREFIGLIGGGGNLVAGGAGTAAEQDSPDWRALASGKCRGASRPSVVSSWLQRCRLRRGRPHFRGPFLGEWKQGRSRKTGFNGKGAC